MLNLEPKRVFYYFEEISKIPRGSGNEKEISDYLKNFAKENNLEVIQDEYLNIVIKKEASKGYENAPAVVLQGHMDMVCEKGTNSNHDFLKDGIELQVEDGFLRGNDTTLGADDGIAVAMGLAILESKEILHPAIELLVTTSEETDMNGALNLSDKVLDARLMINIDSEEEGILTVGSAGGITLFVNKKIAREDCNWKSYEVKFDGLLGGHSGMQIHENRGNILKIMASFLSDLKTHSEYRVNEFTAGTFDNAIPRSGKILLQIKDFPEDKSKLITKVKNDFKDVLGNLEIIIEETSKNTKKAWKEEFTESIIKAILNMPTGVNTFVGDSKLVESSDNLALIKEENENIYFEISIRSSNERVKEELVEKCKKVLEEYKFDYKLDAEYPGWEYKEDSYLRDLAQKIYKEQYGKEFDTTIIHAGLECGAIIAKYKEMDAISIGPNISGAHTPKESLEIESAKRVYNYILELLKNIK